MLGAIILFRPKIGRFTPKSVNFFSGRDKFTFETLLLGTDERTKNKRYEKK